MKVLIAQTSGFCDGVKRAMHIALAAARQPGGLAADGPLVHNHQALELLSLHGVAPASGDSPATSRSRLLIRAHGVPPERRDLWLEAGMEIVDATCVHVARNQRLAREAAERGCFVVLAGDRDHAETRAVAGSAGVGCLVVSGPDDLVGVPDRRNIFFLAQTTFNVELFRDMAAALRRRFPECQVADTICRATHDRQEETARLAGLADVLVVAGGRHSANTRRLAEAGRAAGKPVFLVETAAELNPRDFAGHRVAAVTSGASTPGWITQEVVNRLRLMGTVSTLDRAAGLLQFLVESRVSTALAAGGLALAAEVALLGEMRPLLALAGAGYVFFAHTLNRRIPANRDARQVSHIDSFYQERRPGLLGLAWLAAGVGVALAATGGAASFALFLAAVLATSLFALPTDKTPAWLAKIRQRPSPRHWAMAVGWAMILAGPPALEAGSGWFGSGAMLLVFAICFGGTLVRDLHDIASDSLMGIDTLPARLGPARASRLAGSALGTAAVLPFAAALAAVLAGEGFGAWLLFLLLLPAAPLLGMHLLEQVRHRKLLDAVLLEAGVDGMGVLAGVLALGAGIMA